MSTVRDRVLAWVSSVRHQVVAEEDVHGPRLLVARASAARNPVAAVHRAEARGGREGA
ncbi:hypothetical protein [Streptomyces sundarbansensis]